MNRWLQRLVLLGPGLLYILIFFIVPLGLVLINSFFERGTFGGIVYNFSLDNYERLLRPTFTSIFFRSVSVALLTTVLALLLGYPAAYFIATGPVRWRTPLLALVILPFWTSFLIRTYAWIVLLNNQGLINGLLRNLRLIEAPLPLLYNEFAIVLGLLYGYLPFMVLPLYAAIERLNPELTEASADLGAAPVATFFNVTLPLTMPGVIAGSLFVFIPSLGNFFVPELLGGGRGYNIGRLIQDQYLDARDWPFGSALAVGVMAMIVLLLFVQAWWVNRTREAVR